jgi:hypothetical protein
MVVAIPSSRVVDGAVGINVVRPKVPKSFLKADEMYNRRMRLQAFE